MDIVFNDYSLDGQFESTEAFLDYLVEKILGVFKIMENKGADLLKSYQTFGCNVTADRSIYDLLNAGEMRSYPEITALRSVLVKVTDEPYWNNSSKTDQTAVYSVAETGAFKGDEPNCFSEAVERDSLILSFRHNNYAQKGITVSKNSVEHTIDNITDALTFSDFLLSRDLLTISELLEAYGRESSISFLQNGNSQRYFVDEDIDECLSTEDKLQIKEDFRNFIYGKNTGDMLPRLTKPIHYRNLVFYEFRTTINDDRELRLIYYRQGKTWIFFIGFLKDTQKTPEYIKKRAYDMIKNKILR